MTALPSGHATTDGFASPALAAYYSERARGGVGLIVIEAAWALAPLERAAHLGLYSDVYIPGLRDCIDSAHQQGAVVLMMIDQIISTQQMTVEQLADIRDAWIAAAGRAIAAGADGVMFSCADDGPFDQLISPLTNHRTDRHGGHISRRLQLLLDTVERLQARKGQRLLIGLRLNAEEFTPGGLTLQDARVIAKRLTSAGVGLLEVCADVGDNQPVAQFPGWRVPLATAIKSIVDVPVMVGGLLADAELADSVIRDGSADLVTLGESLRVEPRWPQYARTALETPPDEPKAGYQDGFS